MFTANLPGPSVGTTYKTMGVKLNMGMMVMMMMMMMMNPYMGMMMMVMIMMMVIMNPSIEWAICLKRYHRDACCIEEGSSYWSI